MSGLVVEVELTLVCCVVLAEAEKQGFTRQTRDRRLVSEVVDGINHGGKELISTINVSVTSRTTFAL
jgi:hypothetical protein